MKHRPDASDSGAGVQIPPPEPGEVPPGSSLEQDIQRFRPPEALTTIDEHGRRKWVYPAEVAGRFMRSRKAIGYVLIAIFLGLPWIKIGGMQSILLQIPERRFVLFGHIFWPQDVFYLVFLLIGLALMLFFFTALVGRVWCGWACPQTVFMEEIFRKIEELTEGNHHERRRRDQAPWSTGKLARKGAKHALFLVFSAVVSNTFLAYFVGTHSLLDWMTGPPTEHWTAFVVMAVTLGVFYFDFAWFREQFCVVVCPYARFQSVLTDKDTVQVGYDVVRGEPRGKLGSTSGDCINCFKCVAVCPTGIDIRDGYQLECIGCVRCIDACDSIMDRINKPRGLIRYDSLARLSGERTKLLRPRVLVYSVLLVGVIAALFIGLGTRPMLDLMVVRPPGEPFQRLAHHVVSNHFTLHLQNRSQQRHSYRVAMSGPATAALVVPTNPVTLAGGEQRRVEVFVTIPQDSIHDGRAAVRFQVYGALNDVLLAERDTTFLAPYGRADDDDHEHAGGEHHERDNHEQRSEHD